MRRLIGQILERRIARYFCVGLASLSLDLSLYWLLVEVCRYDYFWSGAAGFVLTTLLNFELGIRFVFGPIDRSYRQSALLLVYAVTSIGLVLHQALLYIGVEVASLHPVVAKLAAVALVFFWNYFSRSRFIFVAGRAAVRE